MMVATLIANATSCDFLDIVPDNIPTIDMAFADRAAAEKYLFTCYTYLPTFFHPDSDPAMLGSGELHVFDGGSINRSNMGLIIGDQNVNGPICNYWDGYMFNAIRDCNIFLEKVGDVHDLTPAELKRWQGEVTFLKAYYHYLLMRAYGAIPIVDKNLNVSLPVEQMATFREPFDKCVEYVVGLLDEAIEMLPIKVEKEITEQGRITKSIAAAVKAQVLTMAASPLFNGNPDYANVVDKRGIHLFSLVEDPEKWELAAEACSLAIARADEAGCELHRKSDLNYQLNDTLQMQCNLKSILFQRWNKEVIWGSTRTDVPWIQAEVMPRLEAEWTLSSTLKGEVCPTLELAETFYSSNGVPIEEDKNFDYSNRYKVRKALGIDRWYVKKDEETAVLHFNREPRFYAAIGFDRGIWWGNGLFDIEKELYYLQVRAGEPAGMRSWERLSQTGYFAKKLMDTETVIDKDNFTTKKNYFPIIRLADLYLMYAEVLNEVKEVPDAEVYKYIDEVRERAGLKGIVESWKNYSTTPDKPLTQKGMREIIHRERRIELALEGKAFWDIRRWKEGLTKWNSPIRGWNIRGESVEEFYNPLVIQRCSFSTRDYLWPIREYSLIVNKNLCQNYGW